jgi:hypothetical protein
VTVMHGTQYVALERAIKLLNASGCKYAVEAPDGRQFGNLPIASDGKANKMKRDYNFARKYNLHAKVDGLNTGEVVVIEADSDEDARRCVKNMSSRGVVRFGRGSCISRVDGRRAELLRVT